MRDVEQQNNRPGCLVRSLDVASAAFASIHDGNVDDVVNYFARAVDSAHDRNFFVPVAPNATAATSGHRREGDNAVSADLSGVSGLLARRAKTIAGADVDADRLATADL